MSDETTPDQPGDRVEQAPADHAADHAADRPVDRAADTPAAGSDSPAARRPAAPGAAAARRARQMGGPRRPSPGPRPTPAADTDAPTGETDAPTRRRPSPRPTPSGRPASSVGKKTRPRPSPRPAASEAEPATAASTPRRSGRVVTIGLAVLAVLLFGVGAVFLGLTITGKATISQKQTDEALSAAKSDVALVTSYGYKTIDSDAAKAAAVLTGAFKDQYLNSIQTVVKPQLPSSQTVTTGQVDTAGLVSTDGKGGQVVILVYGQQAVTNKVQTTPRIDAFQIRVTMQRVGGTWLISKLDQLGNNA